MGWPSTSTTWRGACRGGQQQRLALALAVANDPSIVLLDEPTGALDPRARRAMWDNLRQLHDDGRTVVITTHAMEEAEALCGRVAIIDQGRIVACDSPAQLVAHLGANPVLKATVEVPLDQARTLPGVKGARYLGQHLELETADPQLTLAALQALAGRLGRSIGDVILRQPNLEDVFLMHLRNREVLFWNFAFPVFLMVIFGLIMRAYIDWMTPGIIVLNALSFGLVSSAAMLVEMRDKGILRRLRATPLPALQLLGAYLVVNLLLELCQAGLILASGVLLYHVPLTGAGLALALPLIVAGALSFLALGQLVSGLAPRAGAATAMGMTLYFGMMFISDLIMPANQLPAWLQTVVPYLPSTLVVALVRPALLNATLDPQWLAHLGWLAAYAAAATVIASKVFRWEPRA